MSNRGTDKSDENGALTGTINNHGVEHVISNAELLMLNDITLNVMKSGTVDISQLNGWHTLTIDGTENILLKLFTQALNNINIFLKNPNVTLANPITGNNQNVIITADADMAHATGELRFNFAKISMYSGKAIASMTAPIALAILSKLRGMTKVRY